MKKRMLSFLLALCLIVGMLPVIALAEDSTAAKPSVTFNYVTVGSTMSTVIKAGDAPLYWVTINNNSNNANYYYMKDCKATDEWNVKVEYPADGIPTATLRNATFVEGDSWILQFTGSGTYNQTQTIFDGDVKVILEGTNTASFKSGRPAILLNNSGTATISGPGSLKIRHSMNANDGNRGLITCGGSLVLDNVDLDLDVPAVNAYRTHGITVMNGNMVIKGGNLDITAVNPYGYYQDPLPEGVSGKWYSYRVLQNGIRVTGTDAGNLTIQDGAKLRIVGSPTNAFPEMIKLDGALTVIESDLEFACANGTAETVFGKSAPPTVKPEFKNGYTVTTATSRATYNFDTEILTVPSKVSTYSDIANATLTSVYYFKIAHNCVAGEPVLEKPENTCSTTQDSVTFCTICNKELSRTQVTVEKPEKIHTPGKKVETGRTAAKRESNKITPGKYTYQCTCAICGETWTEEEAFNAAPYYYLESGTANSQWPGYNGNAPVSGATPKKLMQPGDKPIYFTTGQYDTTEDYASYYYMKEATDVTEENEDTATWNIKLEYPDHGTPIMTLKDATIKNATGIYYGVGKYTTTAPLTIKLLGTNTFDYYGGSKHGALNLYTSGDVTFTGPGTLNIINDRYSSASGTIEGHGNLIFDHVNVNFTLVDANSGSVAISNAGKDVIINGGNMTINGFTAAKGYKAMQSAFYITKNATTGEGGNLTIKNGANLLIFGDPGNPAVANTSPTVYYSRGLIAVDNKITIEDSTVELAITPFHSNQVVFSHIPKQVKESWIFPEFEFNYADGYTIVSSKTVSSYNAENGLVRPAESKLTTLAEMPTEATIIKDWKYFKIMPKATVSDPVKFEGTRVGVENDLILEFAIDANKIGEGRTAYITRTRNGVQFGEIQQLALTEANLKDGYYIIPCTGIAAKEMHDLVTVVIKDAEGTILSEIKTDSVYDYIIRMLRGEKDPEMSEDKYAALKTILVDMLNYGTMAQVQFGHNTGNLANKVLTPSEWNNASATTTYEAIAAETTGTGYIGTAFELKSNIAMLMGIDTTELGKGSYAMVYMEGATEGVRVEAEDLENNLAVYTFNGLKATNGNTNVTWKFYTADAAEDAEPILTVTDSLAGYVGRNVQKYPYLADLMKYCDSAAAYFNA